MLMITRHDFDAVPRIRVCPNGNVSGNHNDRLCVLSAYYLPCVNLFNPHNDPVRCMRKPRHRTA